MIYSFVIWTYGRFEDWYALGIKILCLFPLPNLVSHSLTSLKIVLSH